MEPQVQAKRYCGLGIHELTAPNRTIEDNWMLKLAKRLNEEFRPRTLICGIGLVTLKRAYKKKLKNAVRHYEQRQKQTAIVSQMLAQRAGTSSDSSQSQSLMHAPSSTTTTIDPKTYTHSTSAPALASASLKAAAQQQQQHPLTTIAELVSESSSTDDDDEPLLSLNAVNGTRLPHIQPIPKRRQIQLTGPSNPKLNLGNLI